MSFDVALLTGVTALALFAIMLAVRRLRVGRFHYGGFTYSHAEQPVEFWFLVLFPTIPVVVAAVLLTIYVGTANVRFGHAVLQASLAMLPLFWLVRALQSGAIGIRDIVFERARDPREYWLLALAYVVAAGLPVLMALHTLLVPR